MYLQISATMLILCRLKPQCRVVVDSSFRTTICPYCSWILLFEWQCKLTHPSGAPINSTDY